MNSPPRDADIAPPEAGSGPARSSEPASRLSGGAYPGPGLAPFSWRQHYFPGTADVDWDDWRWQFRNRVSTLDDLDRLLPDPRRDRATMEVVMRRFRFAITPYYLSLIDPADPADPMRLQAVPAPEEFANDDSGAADPLAEDACSPVPGIVHRYPDRCLLVATNMCALYCRYCTRKRIMEEDDAPLPRSAMQAMVDYIAATPAIRDVVVSGGDPLTWATPRLDALLAALRAIPHLEIIRIGTRVPVTLPQRVTPELCDMLERYGPLWINVHFNHPREVTAEAALACDRLLRRGIPVNNQSVLLRGVNDDPVTMRALLHALMRIRVRPYYLYHCDDVRGTRHLRAPLETGLAILECLRGYTSGLAVPTYVIDTPGGGGKVPVEPQYLLSYRNGRALLRNYEGRVFEYVDPPGSPGSAGDESAEPPHAAAEAQPPPRHARKTRRPRRGRNGGKG